MKDWRTWVGLAMLAVVIFVCFRYCGNRNQEVGVKSPIPVIQTPTAINAYVPTPVATAPPVECPPPKPVVPAKRAEAPKAPPAKLAAVQSSVSKTDLLHTFEVRKGAKNIALLTLAHDGDLVVNLVHRNKPVQISARKLRGFTLVGFDSGRVIQGKGIGNFQIEICDVADHDRVNGYFEVEGEPGEQYWLNLGLTKATGEARIVFVQAHTDHTVVW